MPVSYSFRKTSSARFEARFLFLLVPVLYFCLIGSPSGAAAQTSVSGFVSSYGAYTTTPPHELISARNRLRLNLRHDFPDGRVYASGDLRQLFASSADSLDFRMRELFMDVFLPGGDLRIGKQVVVWGKTEGDFIFDLVSPFDLSEFLTQDFRELREGVTAVSYTHFFGRNQLQLLINPAFEPSRLPAYDGPWGVVPTDIFPLPTQFRAYDPERITLKDTQLAARFAWRGAADLDLDFALMYWRQRTPAYFKRFETTDLAPGLRLPEQAVLEERYKPGLIAGFWGEYRAGTQLRFPFELAWFQQRAFDTLPGPLSMADLQLLQAIAEAGPDSPPDIPLPELIALLGRFNETLDAGEAEGFLSWQPALKWMAGVQFAAGGWNWSAQYIADVILSPDDEILQDAWFHGITLSTNQSLLRDKLLARLLGRYQFNGQDFWINPELSYALRDGLSITGGAQLFGGKTPETGYPHLSFRQYGPNSLLYLSAAWFW